MKEKRIEYKWIVAAACFLMVFTGLGFCSGTKSLFLKSVSDALTGGDRTLVSLNDSFRFITTAVLNLFFGTMVAKMGTKKMIAAGFGALIASCLVYSFAPNVFVFWIGGVLLGVGLSWSSTTMVGYVIGNWFKENRGTVMGFVLAGNGVGGALATQIVTPMIHDANFGGFGYRNAYRLMALILAVVAVAVLVFVKEAPEGAEKKAPAKGKKKPSRAAAWVGMEFGEATKKGYFFVAMACVFFTGFCLQAVNGVASAHLEDVGMDVKFIATAVSLHALALTVAKIVAGISFDKFGLRATLLMGHAIAAISIFMLAMVTGTGYVLAGAYEILVSFALPLETIMLPLIAADMFGEKAYAKMMGLTVSINTAGYALGGPVANWFRDTVGTYKGALLGMSALMLVILVVFQFALVRAGKDRKRIVAAAEVQA